MSALRHRFTLRQTRRTVPIMFSMELVTGMKMAAPFCPCCDQIDCGVWCDHPGQRRWEHEGAGRPMHCMSCELALVA
ncbi:MAG: hypothetical protein WAL02_11210, partial [Rhodoplanes sp.]